MLDRIRPDRPNPKAPDLVNCPHCCRNHSVFIDRQQYMRAGLLRSWLFNYFVCDDCEQKFWHFGLPVVVSGSYAVGAALLIIAHMARTSW